MTSKKKLKRCKDCGAKGNISQHNLCSNCGIKRQVESIRQLKAKKGDIYEKWRFKVMKAIMKNKGDSN